MRTCAVLMASRGVLGSCDGCIHTSLSGLFGLVCFIHSFCGFLFHTTNKIGTVPCLFSSAFSKAHVVTRMLPPGLSIVQWRSRHGVFCLANYVRRLARRLLGCTHDYNLFRAPSHFRQSRHRVLKT
jgi:hypothetical protein